jgi:hypothetical protein
MRNSLSHRFGIACAVSVVWAVGVLAAPADLSVGVAPGANLSGFHTFSMHDARVDSPRPEFDNSIFVNALTTTIRKAFQGRGFRETAARGDLVVDVAFTNEDASAAESRPRRPLRITRGTLVVDVRIPNAAEPLWRGTYRDEQTTGSELGSRVLRGAEKLVAKFPKQARP